MAIDSMNSKDKLRSCSLGLTTPILVHYLGRYQGPCSWITRNVRSTLAYATLNRSAALYISMQPWNEASFFPVSVLITVSTVAQLLVLYYPLLKIVFWSLITKKLGWSSSKLKQRCLRRAFPICRTSPYLLQPTRGHVPPHSKG